MSISCPWRWRILEYTVFLNEKILKVVEIIGFGICWKILDMEFPGFLCFLLTRTRHLPLDQDGPGTSTEVFGQGSECPGSPGHWHALARQKHGGFQSHGGTSNSSILTGCSTLNHPAIGCIMVYPHDYGNPQKSDVFGI